jgi:hypothetical protein
VYPRDIHRTRPAVVSTTIAVGHNNLPGA